MAISGACRYTSFLKHRSPRLHSEREMRVSDSLVVVSRRSALTAALAAAVASSSRPALATATLPTLYKTATGIIFYDTEFGTDVPRTTKIADVFAQKPVELQTETNPAGTRVILNYRVRSNATGIMDLMEASDSIGLGQPGFDVGDGSVNRAVDELVRTLPKGITRHAVVPPEFKLLRKDQVPYYMEDRWPVTSYLELSLRKQSDSSPVYLCKQVDGSCICDPTAAAGGTDLLGKRD